MPEYTPAFPKPEPRKPKVSNRGRRNKGRRGELAVAKALGGKRTPLSGASGGGDVTVDGWSVEVKCRATLPALIRDALSQAEADIGIGDARRPLVVLKADRQEALYVLREADFLRLQNKGNTDNGWRIRQLARQVRTLAHQISELSR